MSKHLVFNVQHVIIQPKRFRETSTCRELNTRRYVVFMNLNNSLVIRANRQLIRCRQHALAEHSTQRSRVQHKRLVVIKTRRHHTFRRQPNSPHIRMHIWRTADHLHQPVLIARHIRYHAAIINLGYAQPISIRMLGTFNHPDNSRATIFGVQVNHCFDATKLLIDPRHQLIHRR